MIYRNIVWQGLFNFFMDTFDKSYPSDGVMNCRSTLVNLRINGIIKSGRTLGVHILGNNQYLDMLVSFTLVLIPFQFL